ncbi:MAG TPA: hypothetical protein VHK67_03925 [Rhabdochlamydiaceae bacterium]|nr:hypothetical protein [Rhabdochlamydiaceae bacterium]
MALTVFGLTSKQVILPILNRFGPFSYRSFSTARKVANLLLKKPAMTESECQIHNSKIPSYDQVKKSPDLQEKLAKMYEDYATDLEFQEMTMDSMKCGLKTFGKEKH